MKRQHLARSPRKLAIDKNKMRVVPLEQLAEVNGAGDPPRSKLPPVAYAADYY